MRYLSVTEAAKRWNISERSVRNYCALGKIVGAFLKGKTWKIPENAQNTAAPKYRKALYLKVPDTSGELFYKVRQILSENSGDYPVIIYCTSTGKKLQAPDALKIAPSTVLFEKLKALLGEENVKFIK